MIRPQDSVNCNTKQDLQSHSKDDNVLIDLEKDIPPLSIKPLPKPPLVIKDGDVLAMAPLGRNFEVGQLYDCRKDVVIQDGTLWDMDTLQNNLNVTKQTTTMFNVLTSDTLDEKASALNVNLPLKASILAGLVQPQGAAEYLSSNKISNQQSRVTLHYSTTSRLEQLNMNTLRTRKVSSSKVFKEKTATHVVSCVLYGIQAFFSLDHVCTKNEKKLDFEKKAKYLLSEIVTAIKEGKGDLKLTKEEQNNLFKCTFHGDFLLEVNLDLTDVFQICSSVPQQLEENPQLAVPVLVWLYPLKQLNSRAASVVQDISEDQVSQCQAVIEELNEYVIKCNDMMNEGVVSMFPEATYGIEKFKAILLQYKQFFQRDLARILPAIRSGSAVKQKLVKILKKKEHSPFSKKSLSSWIECKEKDIAMITSYINFLKDIQVVSRNELNQLIHNPDIEHIVCFNFSSLLEEEPDLFHLKNHLQSLHDTEEEIQTQNLSSSSYIMTIMWQIWLYIMHFFYKPSQHTIDLVPSSLDGNEMEIVNQDSDLVQSVAQKYDYEIISKNMRACAIQFIEFSKENANSLKTKFIITSIPDTCPGSFICLYSFGELDCDFQISSKPLPPAEKCVSSDSVTVKLENPRQNTQLEYKKREDDEWTVKNINDKHKEVILSGLLPKSVRCKTVCRSDVGVASDVTEIKTHYKTSAYLPEQQIGETFINKPPDIEERLAFKLKSKDTLLKQGSPSFYRLKLRSSYINKYREIVKCTFGEQISYKQKRTIMLLGATGSGKSTLINGMINYILGVQWEDDLRFKLIYEETCKSQAESQTSKITAYEMKHQEGFQVNYSLTIIDTPGFGDTTGIKRDQEITAQIAECFISPHGFQQIDAVCFVVQASQARLTHAQKYIFDSILSIFGKDIANNILMLITFADAQRPPVLDAITASNIPCNTDDNGNPVYFKFNNSAFYANNKESTCSDMIFDKMFWEMGTQSMKRFFDSLQQMNTKSLSLTKEVLEERKRLETAIEGLQPQIRAGLTKLEEIRKTEEALKQHIDQIESNKNFQYEVEVTETVQESIAGTGKFITNCQKCNYTCHYPCALPNDEQKIRCASMDNGVCRVCPGKCVWSVHSNQQYRFIYNTSKIQRTYDELKKNYEKATGEKMTTEKVFQQLQYEFDEVKDAVCDLIHTSHYCITRLEEIALRPNPLSTPDYIDLLINNEKQEAKPGFMERIKSLEEVKQQAVIIQKVINKEELLPSEKFKYNYKEERKKQRGVVVRLSGAAYRGFKNIFT
ncbi:uncharacterized protein LOC114643986 [Erpetoichthys calabaricus]|uniref:uncharacterized protein LOC114643986 n=1 Tax=Erpetoichthys calabaricus TaxID=27687 RepID=UPI002234E374|nr:uncharacterized protein LOC114643986 [Erpetoichthys calabaricus]